jgi:hypothetical protein
VSTKIDNLNRRVGKVENRMAAKEQRERLAGCNCKQDPEVTVIYPNEAEEFEAEMNKTCPAHGQRYLGHIIAVYTDYPHQPDRVDELLHEYHARLEKRLGRKVRYETREV